MTNSYDELLNQVCDKCRPIIRVLIQRITELERRLECYENAHTPPSLKWRTVKTEVVGTGRVGRPRGHVGVTRPQAKPTKVMLVKLDRCPHCQGRLGKPVRVESRVVEEIPMPPPIQVTEFLVHHYKCKSCGRRAVASHPSCPKEGILGPRVLAHITLLKYSGRLPHRKVCEALKREYGLEVTPATVLDVTRRVSDSLKHEYEQVRESIRSSRVLYIDETGFRVQGVNHWLWVFTTETETLVVVRQSRGKKVLKEVLGKQYDGVIVSDGLRSYSNYPAKQQRCWAHILRDVEHIAGDCPECKPLFKAMKRLYGKLVKAIETDPPPEKRMRLHHNAAETLDRWTLKHYISPKAQKLVEKIKTASQNLLTFLLHPGVEPTNNRAERAVREHVVIRKIIGTLRNTKGTNIHETITTLLTTWRQRNQDPYLMIQAQVC